LVDRSVNGFKQCPFILQACERILYFLLLHSALHTIDLQPGIMQITDIWSDLNGKRKRERFILFEFQTAFKLGKRYRD